MSETRSPIDALPSPMEKALVERLYDEGRQLAERVSAYLQIMAPADRSELNTIGLMAYATESMRLTVRSQYCLCWLMGMKANVNGETRLAAALANQFDLKSLDLGKREALIGHEMLPDRFVELCRQVEAFFERLDRLDDRINGPAREERRAVRTA